MTPACSFPGHRHSDDRASLSLRPCGPNPAGARPPAPLVTLVLVAAHAAVTSILAASAKPKAHQRTDDPSAPRYRCASPAPRRWLQKQIPLAHAPISRCFPGAKSPRRTDNYASLSLRLLDHAATFCYLSVGCGARRRHLHPCRLRQAKSPPAHR